MSRYFLVRLQIEGFRGINNSGAPLDLRFRSDAVNSIWAPNGLGKSSIFEALSYAIRGEVSKLERLEASERPEDYYCNRFHKGNATIALTLSPDNAGPEIVVEVVRSRDGTRTVTSPSGHQHPEELLQSLNEDHTLLDYATFATFMENSALDRGRSFSSLLGMSYLSRVRQVLEQLAHKGNLARDFDIRELTARRDRLDADFREAYQSLRSNYLQLTGGTLPDPINVEVVIEQATAALSGVALLAPEFEGHTLMSVLFDALGERIRSAEGGKDRDKLLTTIRQISGLEKLAANDIESQERNLLGTHMSARDKALDETRGALFQALYLAAQAVLESGKWTMPELCPACESRPNRRPAEHIAEHLEVYAAAAEQNDEMIKVWTAGLCARRLRDLEANTVLGVPEDQRTFAALDASFRQGTATEVDLSAFKERLDSLEASRLDALQRIKAEKYTLEKRLPPSLVTLTEQVEVAKQLRDNILSYNDGAAPGGARSSTKRQLAQRKRWELFIQLAGLTFANAETDLSRKHTMAMEERYQGMYSAIMQRDEIVPTLSKPSGTERLDLRLDRFFDQEGLSARALLSESYRNAFGIAVFLSAALEKRTPPRFIVLDDITSSFDAGHQWFLMELLRTQVARPENDNGVQLIILSHDGLLEKYFDKLANQGAWSHHRLQGQSPTGAVLSEAQEANRLRADAERFLAAGQVRQAEPLIRQYLEFKLVQIITKVRIPVPIDFVIRDDRRMVQNCLDNIMEMIDLHKRAGDLILDSGQLTALQGRHVPSIVGNWVSHYETGSVSSLAPSVCRAVLSSIDDLADCFRYLDSNSGNRRYYKALNRRG